MTNSELWCDAGILVPTSGLLTPVLSSRTDCTGVESPPMDVIVSRTINIPSAVPQNITASYKISVLST